MNIGANIKKFRKGKMTQKELAEKIGVTASTVTKYENGNLEPNLETLNKIALALNVSKYELLDYGEYLDRQIDDFITKEGKTKYKFANNLTDDTSSYFSNKNIDIISLSEDKSFTDTLDDLLKTYQFQNEFNIDISKLTTIEKEELKDNIYKYIKFICNEILTSKNNTN